MILALLALLQAAPAAAMDDRCAALLRRESAAALAEAGTPLFSPLETRWYRVGAEEAGVRQLVVADPDGYLLRFQSSLGRRPARADVPVAP